VCFTENVDWSLHWIEFGDVSLDIVEAVLVCPAESVSPHELVQITKQLADCRSVHGFKSSFAFVLVPLDVLGVYAGTWVDTI
jgi:hypothetical protein